MIFATLDDIKNLQKQEISTEKRAFVLSKRVTGKKVSKKGSKVPIRDFYTMLFSRENDIFDIKKSDNMVYSLNYYWINSSHNTYLMGKLSKRKDSETIVSRFLWGSLNVYGFGNEKWPRTI